MTKSFALEKISVGEEQETDSGAKLVCNGLFRNGCGPEGEEGVRTKI